MTNLNLLKKSLYFALIGLFTLFSGSVLRAQNNYGEAFTPQKVDFQYMDAKLRISYLDSKENFSAKVKLRVKKDEIIWASISKTGVEGVRIMITKDSVFIINRLDNESKYQRYDFNELSHELNFRVNFELVQAVLIGEVPPLQDLNEEKIVEQGDEYIILSKISEKLIVDNSISKQTGFLEKIYVKDPLKEGDYMQIDYKDFRDHQDFSFPYFCSVWIEYLTDNGNNLTSVKIEHQEVIFGDTPLSFPFNMKE